MVEPHPSFAYMRPDEVAECWEGVPREMYSKIWNEVVPVMEASKRMPSMEAREDMGPGDVVGICCTKDYWHLFSVEEQVQLNQIAEANSQW